MFEKIGCHPVYETKRTNPSPNPNPVKRSPTMVAASLLCLVRTGCDDHLLDYVRASALLGSISSTAVLSYFNHFGASWARVSSLYSPPYDSCVGVKSY